MTKATAGLMRYRGTLAALPLLIAISGTAAAGRTLLNVSYDVSREFYADYNAAFVKHWQATSNEAITVKQSHGGSSKQARAVIDAWKPASSR